MADVLKINMFGGLSVFYGDKVIVEHASRLNKPLELLALLILQQDKVLSNEQMMEELWGIDTLDNPVGALKTAIYSLRKILEQASDDDYIIMENGRYKWNKEIRMELDVSLFEEMTSKIFAPKTDDETQLKLGKKAIALYAGDLLPGLSDRQWMMGYSNLLRQNYLKVVTNTSKLLMATENRDNYEEVINICNKAVLLEPLQEELYRCLFEAMKALDMKQGILNYYPIVSNLFYDELGERLGPELHEIYMWASEGSNQAKEDLWQVKRDLAEITQDASPVRGAYYCHYEMFKHMYQMVARSAERAGNMMVVMLITITTKPRRVLPKQQVANAMLVLKGVVKDILRKGDVFSRYSRNQYILMLPMNELDDAEVVERRILEGYDKQKTTDLFTLDIQSQELDTLV